MSLARMIAQAKPAHPEAPEKRPRPAAKRAAIIFSYFKFIGPFGFYPETSLSHSCSPVLRGERHSEMP
jgi:hypothetical protein